MTRTVKALAEIERRERVARVPLDNGYGGCAAVHWKSGWECALGAKHSGPHRRGAGRGPIEDIVWPRAKGSTTAEHDQAWVLDVLRGDRDVLERHVGVASGSDEREQWCDECVYLWPCPDAGRVLNRYAPEDAA